MSDKKTLRQKMELGAASIRREVGSLSFKFPLSRF